MTAPLTKATIAEYVTERAGLAFEGAREPVLRDALDAAIRTDSTLSRPPLLGPAFARLCDSVTVQESFFFREPSKLGLLREWCHEFERLDGPLRVWSAGCAEGEEVYTLAAVMHEVGFAGRYRILGTDLAGAAVEAARGGTYARWSLRGLQDEVVDQLFLRHGEHFRVREHLRSGIEFVQHNLLDPLPPHTGTFDVVYCRNVLIYLTEEAVVRAARRLTAALAPGGWLVTGAADPLLDRVDGLESVVSSHGLVYRRVEHGATRTRPSAPNRLERGMTPQPLVPTCPEEVDLPGLLTRATRALDQARPRKAERLARRAIEVAPRCPEARHALVLALAQRGLFEECIAEAATAVAMFPTDGDLHHLYAVVLLESSQAELARRAAARAVRLDPDSPPAHLLLARTHELLGNADEARRARDTARRLLAGWETS